MCTLETEWINSIYSDLPDRDSIDTELGDYSSDHYIGKRAGIEYTLDFYSDPENNESRWFFYPVNLYDVSEKAQNINTHLYDSYSPTGGNKCKMSSDDAVKMAEQICSDLDMPYMKVKDTATLRFIANDNYDPNGYYFFMNREYEGTQFDGYVHYYNEPGTHDTNIVYVPGEMQKTYDRERVYIGVNDTGLVSILCSGRVDIIDQPQITTLLPLRSIQDKFREILKERSRGAKTKYERLILSYLRVPDESEENVYNYVPAWRLNSYYWDYFGNDSIGQNYWVNAIDGTEMDVEKLGDGDYYLLENIFMEFNMK